jgi:hypothetical protein
MKLKSFTYVAIIIILLGMFEGGIRSIASVITKQHAIELNDDYDGPAKEKETERPDHLTTKEYIPQILGPEFRLPVYYINTALAAYTGNFSYLFHPEVLTPPPNV